MENNVEKKREYNKQYYLNNIEKKKKRERERYLNNKKKILESRKDYYLNNVEKIKEKNVKYYEINKEKILKNKKEYYVNNKEDIINYGIKYKRNRYTNDKFYRLTKNIRNLISNSIKKNGHKKTSKIQNILGCTFEEFKIYLENKFESWMSWDNYGNWNGQPKESNISWDIDHIIPVSTACSEEDIIKLNHYMNLQPLCSYENRFVKSNKI
jgi:hypothetical protein